MKKIILASTSPQRKVLMELLKIPFEIEASNYEEDMSMSLSPAELVKELSYGKAFDVARRNNDAIVIGADSVVAYNNTIFGKSYTFEKAVEALLILNGTVHSVYTGFTIIDTEKDIIIKEAVETKIYFKKLTKVEIERYVSLDMPLQNSGSYKIQSLGTILVEKIEGDYNNVVGLPVSRLAERLKEVGVKIL